MNHFTFIFTVLFNIHSSLNYEIIDPTTLSQVRIQFMEDGEPAKEQRSSSIRQSSLERSSEGSLSGRTSLQAQRGDRNRTVHQHRQTVQQQQQQHQHRNEQIDLEAFTYSQQRRTPQDVDLTHSRRTLLLPTTYSSYSSSASVPASDSSKQKYVPKNSDTHLSTTLALNAVEWTPFTWDDIVTRVGYAFIQFFVVLFVSSFFIYYH